MAKRRTEVRENIYLPPGTNKIPEKKIESAPIKPPDPVPTPIKEEPEHDDYSHVIEQQNRTLLDRLRDGDINVIKLRNVIGRTSDKVKYEKEDKEREYLSKMGYDYDEIFDTEENREAEKLLGEYGIR